MKKLLLLPLLLSMTLTAAAGDEVDKPDDKSDVVVRTGTCGATVSSAEKNCKSVGINVKTGEIVMSVDAGGKDVWTEGSAVVVGQLATQSALDATNERITDNASLIADVDQASKDRDIVISADVAVNKDGVATNASAIASTNAELSTVSGKVDANKFAHDNLEARVKQADIHLVETDVRVYANAQGISANSSSIDGLRDYSRDNRAAIAGNSSRIDWNSVSIGNLQHDINRLDGQIAAQVAASAAIMPSNWDGRFAVTVGVGSYRGQTGLALGIMHDNGDWAVKAQVTGTDADNWSDLAVGASVGFAF